MNETYDLFVDCGIKGLLLDLLPWGINVVFGSERLVSGLVIQDGVAFPQTQFKELAVHGNIANLGPGIDDYRRRSQ